MILNKADQILSNEIRKIDVKIRAHYSAIRKLEYDKKVINIKINNKLVHPDGNRGWHQ